MSGCREGSLHEKKNRKPGRISVQHLLKKFIVPTKAAPQWRTCVQRSLIRLPLSLACRYPLTMHKRPVRTASASQ
jgi:hypothetical protein